MKTTTKKEKRNDRFVFESSFLKRVVFKMIAFIKLAVLLTIVKDVPSLTIINDDPSLTIIKEESRKPPYRASVLVIKQF